MTLSIYYIRLGALGQQGAAGKVYECPVCSIRLSDAGTVGRVLRGLLLLLCLAGIGFLVSLLGPSTLGLFKDPAEVGALLWIIVLALTATMGGLTWAIGRSLRRLFLSRYVETKGVEAGV